MIKEIENVQTNDSPTLDEKVELAQQNLLQMNVGYGDNLLTMIGRIRKYGNTIPTGYADIDKVLHGGFRTGISIITAPPGNGKTSFAIQLAEHFNRLGHQTIYFSNDMSEEELTSKSLSRHSYLIANKQGFSGSEVMNSLENIIHSSVFQTACENFKNSTKMLRIVDMETSSDLNKITTLLNAYSAYGIGQQKVVIIDFIQNVAVEGANTDKERLDILIKTLQTLAKNNKMIIILISSIARYFYDKSLTMDSLKESGGLEFGADLILALQHIGIGKKEFDIKKAKSKPIWDMEVAVLKNRFGGADISIPVSFYPKYNLFPYYDRTSIPKMVKTKLSF
ncbi:DnaB-like helicase C-terminal domain-containing protein [Schinkia azotoformans]|uniref:DnaB-like helicase C-terminal domain-containing protein n=1 Tax=Schinkia azotoformans TaxID=1454 RepID=UPI00031530CA|nr:DnaB-like helicase C-terminal domain-containing protein [Schinkia azotoformans]MEC1640938.1 DnaB-like helicase C-terminal domain-containing protein [Schinkia azotoformans]MEC1947632.1 DnaB-like helicase C-terminal domain-containing protein [Schinkia azotoformans]